MFNCLPGAMLEKRHTHQCPKDLSCSRVYSQHNARTPASHRLFNPGPPGGKARMCIGIRTSGATAPGPCPDFTNRSCALANGHKSKPLNANRADFLERRDHPVSNCDNSCFSPFPRAAVNLARGAFDKQVNTRYLEP